MTRSPAIDHDRRRLLLALAAAPAAVALPARAARAARQLADAPEALIRRTVDDAFAVLKDKALAGGERRARRIAALRQVADRVFDWGEMARSSLGVHWRALDAQQRTRFVAVFKDILAAQYMDDIDRFQGTEVVTVDGSVRQGEEVLVRTTLVTASRERVPIDYRLRAPAERWAIVDLSIEGVSLVNHFRKSFSGALANMTIDQLIDRLTRQLPR
jgi:phospholipid transport system substrate-binding protein